VSEQYITNRSKMNEWTGTPQLMCIVKTAFPGRGGQLCAEGLLMHGTSPESLLQYKFSKAC
jgi:hypothetical protein